MTMLVGMRRLAFLPQVRAGGHFQGEKNCVLAAMLDIQVGAGLYALPLNIEYILSSQQVEECMMMKGVTLDMNCRYIG